MQSICTMLQSEEGSQAAVDVAKKLWPQLLGLLGDLLPAVRQSAATAVGLLGALATKDTAQRRPAQGLFCDDIALCRIRLHGRQSIISALIHHAYVSQPPRCCNMLFLECISHLLIECLSLSIAFVLQGFHPVFCLTGRCHC